MLAVAHYNKSDRGRKGGARMVKPSTRSSSTARIFDMFVFWVNFPIVSTGHLYRRGMTKSCNAPFDLLSLYECDANKGTETLRYFAISVLIDWQAQAGAPPDVSIWWSQRQGPWWGDLAIKVRILW